MQLLAQYGPLAVICGWFMLKAEPKLEEIRAAFDRNSRALLLIVVNQPTTPEPTRKEAQALLAEIDEADAKAHAAQAKKG